MQEGIICPRVESVLLPVDGSTREQCEYCRSAIWSHKELRDKVREESGAEPVLICTECHPDMSELEQIDALLRTWRQVGKI